MVRTTKLPEKKEDEALPNDLVWDLRGKTGEFAEIATKFEKFCPEAKVQHESLWRVVIRKNNWKMWSLAEIGDEVRRAADAKLKHTEVTDVKTEGNLLQVFLSQPIIIRVGEQVGQIGVVHSSGPVSSDLCVIGLKWFGKDSSKETFERKALKELIGQEPVLYKCGVSMTIVIFAGTPPALIRMRNTKVNPKLQVLTNDKHLNAAEIIFLNMEGCKCCGRCHKDVSCLIEERRRDLYVTTPWIVVKEEREAKTAEVPETIPNTSNGSNVGDTTGPMAQLRSATEECTKKAMEVVCRQIRVDA